MKVEHPSAGDGPGVAPAQVDVAGENVSVDEDGVFEAPEGWVQTFADRHDADVDELRVGGEDAGETSDDEDICGAEKSDGTTCERPAGKCPYHGDEEE